MNIRKKMEEKEGEKAGRGNSEISVVLEEKHLIGKIKKSNKQSNGQG